MSDHEEEQQWVAQLDAAWALVAGAQWNPLESTHAGGEEENEGTPPSDSWVPIRREASHSPLLSRSPHVAFSRARHISGENGPEEGGGGGPNVKEEEEEEEPQTPHQEEPEDATEEEREEGSPYSHEGTPSPTPGLPHPTLQDPGDVTEADERPQDTGQESRPLAWKSQALPSLQRTRSDNRFSLGVAKKRRVQADENTQDQTRPWTPPVAPSLIPVRYNERAQSLGGTEDSAGPTRAHKTGREERESWAIQSINVSGSGQALATLRSPRGKKSKLGGAPVTPPATNLVATIATCEGMPRLSVLSPFCVVRWERESRSFRTRTAFNSQAPVWNETFELAFPAVPTLQVEVWNQTSAHHEDLLGLGTVSFDSARSTELVYRVPLKRPGLSSSRDDPLEGEEEGANPFCLVIRAERVAVERKTEKLIRFLQAERALVRATYRYMEDKHVEAPAFAMVELFHAVGGAADWLAELVGDARHHTALRTSRSLLRKMLGVFCRYSRDSCLGLLRPLLAQIHAEPHSLEVRLSYLQRQYEAPVEELLREEQQANKQRLVGYLREIVRCVRRVAFDIHPDLRMLCQLVAEQMADDPESKRRVLGDLLFQKFLCPVIASPSAFGLIPESASLGHAQSGIVLSKVLVNVGAQKLFPASHELAIVNDYIQESQEAVDAFYALVSGRHSPFTVMLYSVQEREQFRRHLAKQLCAENLEFWEDCQEYRSLNGADRHAFSKVIYKLYIDTGAERELNLEVKTVKHIRAQLEASPENLFDEAIEEVLTLLRADSFYKFSGRRRTATISSQLVTSSVRIQCIREICRFYVEHRGSLRQALPDQVEEATWARLDDTLQGLSMDYNPHGDARVLNRTLHWSSTGKLPQPAWLLAASLLARIGDMYRDYFTESGSGEINDSTLLRLTQSEAFHAFCNATAELQRTKVHNLSNNQKLVFWVNLYNTLMLHAYLHVGQPDSHRSWLKFQSASCYEVDGHLYSLSDIEHGVLRASMPPSKWLQLQGPCTMDGAFSAEDGRVSSVLRKPVPYLTFLLCNATTSSPFIRIYHPGSCQKEMLDTVKAFLVSHPLQVHSREIQVPLVYKWYAKDNHLDKRKALRQLVALLDEGEAKDSLLQALKTPSLKVLYQPAEYQFLPVFDVPDPSPCPKECSS